MKKYIEQATKRDSELLESALEKKSLHVVKNFVDSSILPVVHEDMDCLHFLGREE
jgi:hypothetical protein